MSAAERALDLRWLRLGLLFCSPDWRPRIEARIAALQRPLANVPGGVVCMAPGTVAGQPVPEGAVYSRHRIGGRDHAPPMGQDGECPQQPRPPAAPLLLPGRAAGITRDNWREARKQLRQAGHDVKQYGDVVFVDGHPSDDRGLYP